MQNITINGIKKNINLNRDITLNNGALVLQKHDDKVVNVFMVVSFRDNKNNYAGQSTAQYCTLVNLDNGVFSFEERCSRKTTVRRVLSHLLRLNDYGCNRCSDNEYDGYDIEILAPNTYNLDISF